MCCRRSTLHPAQVCGGTTWTGVECSGTNVVRVCVEARPALRRVGIRFLLVLVGAEAEWGGREAGGGGGGTVASAPPPNGRGCRGKACCARCPSSRCSARSGGVQGDTALTSGSMQGPTQRRPCRAPRPGVQRADGGDTIVRRDAGRRFAGRAHRVLPSSRVGQLTQCRVGGGPGGRYVMRNYVVIAQGVHTAIVTLLKSDLYIVRHADP